MTEPAEILDRAAYARDEAEHARRLRNSSAPVLRQLFERRTAEEQSAEQQRLQEVRRSARDGLIHVAKVIGMEAVGPTADLLDVELPEEIPGTHA